MELGASNIFGRRGTCKNRDGLDDPARRRGSGRSRSWRPCGSRELMAYSSSKGRNGSETPCADGGGAGASREQGHGDADGEALGKKEQLRRWLRGGGGATGRLGQRDQALEAQATESRRSWLHRWGHRRGLERKRDWPAAWLEREALAPLWRQREEAAATRLEELLSLSARAMGQLAPVEGGGG